MANPIYNTLSDVTAEALGGTLNANIGLSHLSKGQDDQSTPKLFTQLITIIDQMFNRLATNSQGAVVQINPGLIVDVYALDYEIATTAYSFAGGPITLAASNTHKIYLDSAATLKSTTAAWPVDVVKLAIVTTDATLVTNIQDVRFYNFGLGVSNSWYNITALAPPHFNDLNLVNVGGLGVIFNAAQTITAGSATVNKYISPIRGEGSVDDDLVTLVNGDPSGLGIVILTGDTGGGLVTVKSTGNIVLTQGDFLMASLPGATMLTLVYNSSNATWYEVSRNVNASTFLNQDFMAFDHWIRDLGGIDFGEVFATIAAGTLARTESMIVISSETGTTDDLDTITGGTANELLILRAGSTHTITVKHALITDGFSLANGRDFVLDSGGTLICRYDATLSRWNEVSRSPMKTSDLIGTDNAIYTPIKISIAGNLVAGGYFEKIKIGEDMVIKWAEVQLGTAPTSTNLVIDVKVAGLSMFNDASEMINATPGNAFGSSALKNKQVNAGQVVQVFVNTASSAADATVTLHVYSTPVTPVVGV